MIREELSCSESLPVATANQFLPSASYLTVSDGIAVVLLQVMKPYLSALSLHLVSATTSHHVLSIFAEVSKFMPDMVLTYLPCILRAAVMQPVTNMDSIICILSNIAKKLQVRSSSFNKILQHLYV
jgi:hypothetical protein